MRTVSLPLPANVRKLKPYASARSLLKGDKWTFMDANESPAPGIRELPSVPSLNRYPDPTADKLRDTIAASYEVKRESIIMGNGSDELIDLSVRSFVRRGRGITSIAPTYGMYRVSADTNGVAYDTVPLGADGILDIRSLLSRAKSADLLFLCSPNNPTGTVIGLQALGEILDAFPGIVVADEAYGEFADAAGIPSAVRLVCEGRKNLLVLRTFSKAYAAAGIRLGYGIASPDIIGTLLKMKAPYNVNSLTQEIGLQLWRDAAYMRNNVLTIIAERDRLMNAFAKLGCRVHPSVTNFFLLDLPQGKDATAIYRSLRDESGIVLRLIEWKPKTLLRVTVGSPRENALLLSAISLLL